VCVCVYQAQVKEEKAKRIAQERENARQRAVAEASAKRNHAKEVRLPSDVCLGGATDSDVCCAESQRYHPSIRA
jgi:hypothetical protein